MFAPIGIHSYYSFGWGTASPEAICEAVKEMGATTLAVTDRDNLYGLFFLRNVARDNGLRLIIGAEVTALDEKTSLFLFPVDETGYQNLCGIITDRHIATDFDLIDSIITRSEGLVIIATTEDQAFQLCGQVDNLYVGLRRSQPNRKLLLAAKQLGLPPVALENSFWAIDDDYELHRLNRAISMNKSLSGIADSECAPRDSMLTDEDELRRTFNYCPEAVDNTLEIANLCRYQPDFGIVYPPIPDPDVRTPDQILREKAYAGALQRYGEVTVPVKERLKYELELIASKGFAPVFLVVEDIVRQAPRTCGRGSAAASIVSYCLGITQVEPIRHNLFFERFISTARKDPPDIDIDFPWDERDGVLDYVFQRYGVDRAAMVSNHNTFQDRGAIHEVAKVFGLPEAEITEVTKKMGGGYGWLGLEVTDHPALTDHGFPAPWPKIFSLAKRLEDIPRHLSVHCGGVVITPDVTSHWCPTEVAAKGVRVLQWEKDQTEGSGLVKIDLLGNRSLAVIRDACNAAREHWGAEINFDKENPVDDPATKALMSSGDTMGVFYVESPATRMLQKKAGVGDYDHLVLHTSIIRPAANKYINLYLRRLKGEPWEPLHPLIGDLLDENYGIMIYQEDVTRVAMQLAGFDIAEADELRKILSQKHKKRRLIDLMHKFYAGAGERGATREQIDEIWEMIMSFAGYSFCKPHSASYALVSFQSGWLKAHYKAEFIAAVLSNQGGYYSTFAYISEAKRMRLEVLPPDVNYSNVKYIGCGSWVRIGLMQIKGLPTEAQERIIKARLEEGEFISLEDCIVRAELTPSEARFLVKAGCFDIVELGRSRPELLWQIAMMEREGDFCHFSVDDSNTLASRNRSSGGLCLFGVASLPESLPKPPEYSERTLLELEIETLGFLASRHPLDLYRDQLRRRPVISGADLSQRIRKRVELAGWLVTSKLVLTKRRDPMEFVTFEDSCSLIETTFFPQIFKRFSHILSYTKPYRLFGKVEDDFGQVTLNVERVEYL